MRYNLDRSATHLPDEVFDNPEIEVLNASFSNLEELSPRICELQSLRVLKLSHVKISTLPDLSGLPHLEEVTLWSPNLPVVPEQLRGLSLKRLDLSVEQPYDGEILASLSQLEELELQLRSNTYERIVEGVFRLPLRKLVLKTWNGKLHSIDGLGLATGLVELTLDVSGPTELDDSLGQLTALKKLRLECSQVTELPSSLSNLVNLRELSISSMKLSAFPDPIYDLIELRDIRFNRVPITRLDDRISRLRQLESLHLHGHQLERLPDALGDLPELTNLALESTSDPGTLTELPDGLANLHALTSLELSGAAVATVPASWSTLTNLKRFTATDSQITTLPDSWSSMNLEGLNLSGTPMRRLPPCVFAMTKLDSLRLRGCDFTPKGFKAVGTLGLKSFNLSLPEEGLPDPDDGVSTEPLTATVIQALGALGATLTAGTPDPSLQLTIGGTAQAVPEAIRQLVQEVTWPASLTLKWLGTSFALQGVAWDALVGFAVVEHAPWVALLGDGEGTRWIVGLHDPDSTDPRVYRLHARSTDLDKPLMAEGCLSQFLSRIDAGGAGHA